MAARALAVYVAISLATTGALTSATTSATAATTSAPAAEAAISKPAAGSATAPATDEVAATSRAGDWPTYGNDSGTRKYSPLDEIRPDNVADVRVAWVWPSPDNAIVARRPELTPWGYKVTPVAIDGVLYVSTSLGHVAAIEGATGRTLWTFDTRSYEDGRPTNLGFNHRGVAVWRDGAQARVLMPTNNGFLWALDARTGTPVREFGTEGKVDLTTGLGRPVDRRMYSVISAPIVVGDVVVVGASILDGPPAKTMPPGHVRGFDVMTGAQRWIFHTIPQQGEHGSETWENESWAYSGNTNVWTGMSADPELGYVYLPTGTPTNDWYGGHRLGDNLFAESLICLEAATGKRVWHFQFVHHGLWDYDLPAAPTLMDIDVDGRPIKAVTQVTKQGFAFVFDRVTGKPVWPIAETPVPPSTVPGERASPTQPVPSRPAPFDRQGLTVDDLIDFSPELREQAQQIIAPFDHGPLYTPPSLRGAINLPGWGGGANWWGAAFDPVTHVLYVPSATGPMVVKLREADPAQTDFAYVRSESVNRLSGPQGLPLTKPPYGRITAIDMDTGEHLWMVPHGNGPRQKLMSMGFADPGPLGAPGTGPLLTATLLFVAQADTLGNVLRAYDKATGAVLAEIPLPAAPWGTPMTFVAGGVQYVAIASGAAGDAHVVALALPHTGASRVQRKENVVFLGPPGVGKSHWPSAWPSPPPSMAAASITARSSF